MSATAWRQPASSTTCRSFSNKPRRCLTICPARHAHLSARQRRPGRAGILAGHAKPPQADARRSGPPAAAARRTVPARPSLFHPAQALCASGPGGSPAKGRPAPCRRLTWTAVHRIPWPSCRALSLPGRARSCSSPTAPGAAKPWHEFFADHGLAAAPCENWASSPAQSGALAAYQRPAVRRLHRGGQKASRSLPKPSSTPCRRAPGRARGKQVTQIEGLLRDLSELKIGDPVVHAQHGVGRYLGLITLDTGDGASEFLHLEYAGSDKLYVPVANLGADRALQRRGRRAHPACTNSAPNNGKRLAARPCRRHATPPPNCSISMRGAPPARATRLR